MVRSDHWGHTASVLLTVGVVLGMGQAPPAGRLTGRIVADDRDTRPLAGAVVTVSESASSTRRATVTDYNGDFTFDGLPSGRYSIEASKPPYVPMAYGARRPGRPGTQVAFQRGVLTEPLVIRLPLGAVITGTLRARDGQPLAGASVQAFAPRAAPGRITLEPSSAVESDDRGEYRIFALAPGSYYVRATMSAAGLGTLSQLDTTEIDRRLALLQAAAGQRPLGREGSVPGQTSVLAIAGVFFPGTADAAEAQPIPLAAGEERVADFIVQPVPAGRVTGSVRSADTRTWTATVALERDGPPVAALLGSFAAANALTSEVNAEFAF